MTVSTNKLSFRYCAKTRNSPDHNDIQQFQEQGSIFKSQILVSQGLSTDEKIIQIKQKVHYTFFIYIVRLKIRFFFSYHHKKCGNQQCTRMLLGSLLHNNHKTWQHKEDHLLSIRSTLTQYKNQEAEERKVVLQPQR